MIMPPRNPPSVSDSPISPVAQLAASATSSALAVKTSALSVRAMRSNSGRTTSRASAKATPKAAAALTTAMASCGAIAPPSPFSALTMMRRKMAATS